ncbi:collagen alpha-1(I) chain-like [Antechinus flavipes]|uniref:collagen alpha-1(I) chain-like n=1 Tax=Antechinus flavipes TaxID=38775 RepID=UPI002236B82A|nr:collagen alpha-1(I) chain-like [Antechinus flavipes]
MVCPAGPCCVREAESNRPQRKHGVPCGAVLCEGSRIQQAPEKGQHQPVGWVQWTRRHGDAVFSKRARRPGEAEAGPRSAPGSGPRSRRTVKAGPSNVQLPGANSAPRASEPLGRRGALPGDSLAPALRPAVSRKAEKAARLRLRARGQGAVAQGMAARDSSSSTVKAGPSNKLRPASQRASVTSSALPGYQKERGPGAFQAPRGKPSERKKRRRVPGRWETQKRKGEVGKETKKSNTPTGQHQPVGWVQWTRRHGDAVFSKRARRPGEAEAGPRSAPGSGPRSRRTVKAGPSNVQLPGANSAPRASEPLGRRGALPGDSLAPALRPAVSRKAEKAARLRLRARGQGAVAQGMAARDSSSSTVKAGPSNKLRPASQRASVTSSALPGYQKERGPGAFQAPRGKPSERKKRRRVPGRWETQKRKGEVGKETKKSNTPTGQHQPVGWVQWTRRHGDAVFSKRARRPGEAEAGPRSAPGSGPRSRRTVKAGPSNVQLPGANSAPRASEPLGRRGALPGDSLAPALRPAVSRKAEKAARLRLRARGQGAVAQGMAARDSSSSTVKAGPSNKLRPASQRASVTSSALPGYQKERGPGAFQAPRGKPSERKKRRRVPGRWETQKRKGEVGKETKKSNTPTGQHQPVGWVQWTRRHGDAVFSKRARRPGEAEAGPRSAPGSGPRSRRTVKAGPSNKLRPASQRASVTSSALPGDSLAPALRPAVSRKAEKAARLRLRARGQGAVAQGMAARDSSSSTVKAGPSNVQLPGANSAPRASEPLGRRGALPGDSLAPALRPAVSRKAEKAARLRLRARGQGAVAQGMAARDSSSSTVKAGPSNKLRPASQRASVTSSALPGDSLAPALRPAVSRKAEKAARLRLRARGQGAVAQGMAARDSSSSTVKAGPSNVQLPGANSAPRASEPLGRRGALPGDSLAPALRPAVSRKAEKAARLRLRARGQGAVAQGMAARDSSSSTVKAGPSNVQLPGANSAPRASEPLGRRGALPGYQKERGPGAFQAPRGKPSERKKRRRVPGRWETQKRKGEVGKETKKSNTPTGGA